MTDVPILKVAIDQSEFDRFKENFEKYRKQAADTSAWTATNDQVAQVQKRYEQMLEAAQGHNEAQERAQGSAKGLHDAMSGASAFFAGLFVTSARIGRNVTGSTLDLAKWAKLTGVITGIVGAGGLYGLDVLAANIAQRRYGAQGAGLSIGQASAVAIDYGRLGNTDAMVRGFNDAASDKTKQQPLASLGIDSRGKNAAALISEALLKIKDILDHTDPSMRKQTMGPYNLDQLGIDDNTLREMAGMNRSEIQDMILRAREDSERLQISDEDARKWQDFTNMLERAKGRIGAVFINDLANIEPGLESLSKTVVNLIDSFLKSDTIATSLNFLTLTIGEFGDELASEDVKRKVDQFSKAANLTKQDFRTIGNTLGAVEPVFEFLMGAWASYRVGGALGLSTYMLYATVKPTAVNPEEDPHNDAVGGRRAQPGGPKSLFEEQGGGSVSPADPSAATAPNWLDDRSKRELSGVNKPLADTLLEASAESGIRFKVLEGRRTQDEADANAASGRGVRDSQHLYGAAADIKMIDPNTGEPTSDRSVYQRFADSFNAINKRQGTTNQRWLGDSSGRWGSDIVHFDQGIGYGQSHAPDPYGNASAPTKEDIKASNTEVLKSDANPFTRKKPVQARPDPSTQTVVIHDNLGGAGQVVVTPF